MRDPRRAIDQRFQVALGAANRKVLQHVAAGRHDGDDRSGQSFADRQSRRHRQASGRRRFAPRADHE